MTPDVLAAIRWHLAPLDGEVCEDFVLLRWDSALPLECPGDGLEIGCIGFQGAQWPIIHFDSELEVRRYLWQKRKREIVLVVGPDWVDRVPVDIRDRSLERRVRPITVRDVLGSVTSVPWCSACETLTLRALCEQFLDELVNGCRSARAGVSSDQEVDSETLREWIVEAALGFRMAKLSAAQLLANAYRGRNRSRAMQPELAPLLGEIVRTRHPEHAVLLSWALADPSRPEALLEDGARVEAEAAFTSLPTIGRLSQPRVEYIAKEQDKDAAASRFVTQVRDLAVGALRELGPAGCALIERRLDQIGGTVKPHEYNCILPAALEHRIGDVAAQAAGGSRPDPSQVALLGDHLFAERLGTDLAALEAMDHLLGALGSPPEASSAIPLAVWFAEEGAHGDREAKRLEVLVRGKLTDRVRESALELLERYWQDRDALNHAFGEAYASQYDATLFAPQLAGLQRVAGSQVKQRIGAGERVLLICLDGCSYPDFLGLVDELVAGGYGLLDPKAQPGLALLPSTTEVSRLALFAGQVPEDPIKLGHSDAVQARDRQAAAFSQAIKPHAGRLLLKGDLNAGFAALQEAIGDASLSAVALVINSIDDAIGTAGVLPQLFELSDVAHLKDAIAAGCDEGRTVIVTADHGHTFHRTTDLRRKGPDGIAERMVGIPGGTAPAGVVRFAHPVVNKLLGLDAVGLLTRTGEYACTQPRGGYHGGASLEECVVPCVVIGRRGVAPPKPAWWSSEAPAAAPEPVAADAVPAPGDYLVIRVGTLSRRVPMPSGLSAREVEALQALSQQHDRRLETPQLANLLGTRPPRVEGMMADLIQKLAAQGKEWVRAAPGPNGAIYELITDRISEQE